MNKVLFVTSELYPLVNTGGLAEVSSSLPFALKKLGCDIKIIIPAYQSALKNIGKTKSICKIKFKCHNKTIDAEILQAVHPVNKLQVLLVNIPKMFNRPGNPYLDQNGNDWPDNAERFAFFNYIVSIIATDITKIGWVPDIVHCNDWQTGMIPAVLSDIKNAPKTVFTIHNLAYQGLFSKHTFDLLGFNQKLWSFNGVEFYGKFSFIKGGLSFANYITTVSPSYSKEICSPEFGCGLHELLKYREKKLKGILNGVDYNIWNPNKDSLIAKTYNINSLKDKNKNKQELIKHTGLFIKKNKVPLIGLISRLVEQKGIDLVINILERLINSTNAQIVVLGEGKNEFENYLIELSNKYPDRVYVKIGYSGQEAHLIEAGCDMILIPSRFEPCGLTQLYSLKYGTVPIVRRTGGLKDTVEDVTENSLINNIATGFVFDNASEEELFKTINRAVKYYNKPQLWKKIQLTGMKKDFSWKNSAKKYLELYKLLN